MKLTPTGWARPAAVRVLAAGVIVSGMLLSAGCGQPKPAITRRSEAHKRVLKICRDEYHLPVVLKEFEHTLYLYLPTEEVIYHYVPTEAGPQQSDQPKVNWVVRYLDVKFEAGAFRIAYDIGRARGYASSPGYTSNYTRAFQEMKDKVLKALYRGMGDLRDDVAGTDRPPDFAFLVIADIKTGLENVELFSLADYKRVMMQSMPQDEFVLRYMNKGIVGGKNIIGDAAGEHLDYKDLRWGDFLARQIRHRIDFKFTKSDFEPGDDTSREILKCVQAALAAYNFLDYDQVILTDMTTGQETILSKLDIQTHK